MSYNPKQVVTGGQFQTEELKNSSRYNSLNNLHRSARSSQLNVRTSNLRNTAYSFEESHVQQSSSGRQLSQSCQQLNEKFDIIQPNVGSSPPLLQSPTQRFGTNHGRNALKHVVENLHATYFESYQVPNEINLPSSAEAVLSDTVGSPVQKKLPEFQAKPYHAGRKIDRDATDLGSVKSEKKKPGINPKQRVNKNPNSCEGKRKKKEPLHEFFSVSRKSIASSSSDSGDDGSGVEMSSMLLPQWGSSSDSDDSHLSNEADDSEIFHVVGNASKTNPYSSVSNSVLHREKFVSVYWDIENCPVPSNKSAVDIVKKIRQVLYDGRTEECFIVACDTRNLNKRVVKELAESDVVITHVDSQSKNAADTQLQKFLIQFQTRHRLKDDAVVLVSGDSDFSSFLNEMRYKHHIYVNLICKQNARKALREAPHRCIFYEDFLSDIPDYLTNGACQYFLLISALPNFVKKKALYAMLSEKTQGMCTKISKVSPTEVEMLFPSGSTCKKALEMLQGTNICGSEVTVKYGVRNIVQKQGKENSPKSVTDLNLSEQSLLGFSSIEMCSTTDLEESKQHKKCQNGLEEKTKPNLQPVNINKTKSKVDSTTKSATLCVFVSNKQGDVNYWQKEFGKLFENPKISISWCGTNIVGYFLVNFKTRSQAQKARKLLEANQKVDNNAPKFLKLIKDDSGTDQTNNHQCDVKEINQKKIDEKICCIQSKKIKCLSYFQVLWNSLKVDKGTVGIAPTAEEHSILINKQNELNEQKITFLNFTESTCKRLKSLDITSKNIDCMIDGLMKDYCHECTCFKNGLTIYGKKDLIINKVKKNQVILIQAEAGTGKSTQICQYLWKEGFGKTGLIICTQPQKMSVISLAKHVSSQIGCSVGNIVGYQVGMSKKCSEETKILYVNDCTMLKMCFENPYFKGISCIIIDDVHERTVYTDLLLGMVKQSLQMSPGLKVVITSAMVPISVFHHYFSLSNEAILNVSGTAFPVEDIWLDNTVQLGWDYFDKAISVTYDIIQQGPGDVLVFLATPDETQKAVKKLNMVANQNFKSPLLLYQLHDSISLQEYEKVFEKTPVGAHKVVFATNYAETFVTIPGIRYVVDSGMVKEAHYDPMPNINVLAVGFVSKSSAEQRRGCAGRTQSGKCYRLYSHSNYEKHMTDNKVPEILRVNLGQALLNLMFLGIKNPLMFDFVDSPSNAALSAAMKQLIHLGAVDEIHCSLTERGFQLAKLPLEPRLSCLALEGIKEGIGYTAIIIAALATVSRNTFLFNAQCRDDADLKKMRFGQFESDFLMFVEVYKEWSKLPKAEKQCWCAVNSINSRALEVAHELVNELILTFSNDLRIKVSTKFKSGGNFLDVLCRLILQIFSENLCIFSGHDKIGYLSLNVPESLHIHPSSCLYSISNQRPKYIVYDMILKTAQAFLVNVTVIGDEVVKTAAKKDIMPMYLSKLESLTLSPCSFVQLGFSVLNDIIGVRENKLKLLENSLRDVCNNSQCIVDADFNHGQLNVFVPLQFHKSVVNIVIPIIEGLQMKLLKHESLIANFASIPSLSVVLGAGGEVHDVVLCGEYRDVIIRPPGYDISMLLNTLGKFGEITAVEGTPKGKCITFRTVTSAKDAVKTLEGNLGTFTITPGLPEKVKTSDLGAFHKVYVSFIRRPCTGRASFSILSSSPNADFSEIAHYLSSKVLCYKSSCLRLTSGKKCAQNFSIQNVPENVKELELKSVILAALPEDVGISTFEVERKKGFVSDKSEIKAMHNKIFSMFSSFTSADKLHVDLKSPKPKDEDWKAFVYFENPHDGQNVINILKPSSGSIYSEICHEIIEMKPIVETFLFCSKEVYNAVQRQIEDSLQSFKKGSHKDNELNICAKNIFGGKRVSIQISSNNIADIVDAKKALQGFIQGDQIECSGNIYLENLFTGKGRKFFKELCSKTPNSYINFNDQRKMVSIFGSDSSRTIIKTSINQYVTCLEDESFANISLKFPNGRGSILKQVIKRYGLTLEELSAVSGVSSAVINVNQLALTVSGSENSISQCQKCIADILADTGNTVHLSSSEEECPICYCGVEQPSHQLEYCGHSYCEMCLLSKLQNVEETPILCCVEGCKKPFVLRDLTWAYKKVRSLKSKIYSTAFESFMKKNRSVKYCPSPDCSMIYRINDTGKNCRKTCSLCQNDICTKCGVLFHAGMSCDLYQSFKLNDDYSLRMWLKADPVNRKLCPSCKCPIEKYGRCMHMTCWRCNCHMCWRCMRTFPMSSDVYLHQAVCSSLKI